MNRIVNSSIRNIIGLVYILLCFAFLFLLLFKPIPEPNKDIVIALGGTLVGAASVIISYMYGYSKAQADARRGLPPVPPPDVPEILPPA